MDDKNPLKMKVSFNCGVLVLSTPNVLSHDALVRDPLFTRRTFGRTEQPTAASQPTLKLKTCL